MIYYILYVLVAVPFLVLLRKYIRGPQYRGDARADGKVFIVTGGNGDIGKATVMGLVKRGAKVYIMCRNKKRAEAAKRQIEIECSGAQVHILIADMEDLDSIRKSIKEFEAIENRLDGLICNAGALPDGQFVLTKDRIESTFQRNYLGHFLLSQLVLPLLEKSEDPRIINVSSLMHIFARTVRIDYINDPANYGSVFPYNRSKLAQILCAQEMNRVLKARGSKITVVSCHPGIVNTDIVHGWRMAWLVWVRENLTVIFWYFFKTSEDGAQTSLYLALDKDVPTMGGKYFKDCRPAWIVNLLSYDNEECRKLYADSLRICGLTESEIVQH